MKNSEIKIDPQKYKYNDGYRKMIQERFKNELVQPFQNNGKKNPEFIKRYGEDFYKKKELSKLHVEEENNETRKKRVIFC